MGYRLVLGWNVFTLLFLFLATCFSYRHYRIHYMNKEGDPAEHEDARLVQKDQENLRPRIRSKQEAFRQLGLITPDEIKRETRQRMNSTNKIII